VRKSVVTTFLTLDGVMQSPGAREEDPSSGFTYGGWLVPHADEEMGHQMVEWFAHAEDFGRGTYEIFAAHWPRVPTEQDPIAKALNSPPKHVASRSLDHVGWDGARLIDGEVADEVAALKDRDGGELQVHGSAGAVILTYERAGEVQVGSVALD
jgi:dihydrofolate reductase